MAYTPTNWKNGDVITADRLNKLEQGVQNEQVGPQGETGASGTNGKDGKDAVITPGTAVTDVAEGADAAALRTNLNNLLASLRTAGLLAKS